MAEHSHAVEQIEAERNHLHHIFEFLSALGGKTSPVDHIEEELFRIREGYHLFRLDPVEAGHPGTNFKNVDLPDDLRLVYFTRELQRTQLIGHFVHKGYEVPMHYAITSAIILKRENRQFSAWHQPLLHSSVLVPYQFTDPKIVEEFGRVAGMNVVDTGGDKLEYTQLRIEAVRKAHRMTNVLRQELYEDWLAHEGADESQVLVASGMDVDTPNERLKRNFVALSEQVYVPWQNSQVLETQLQIGPHQRGQALKVTRTEGDPMPKYTWFIRLRGSAKADPEFGLVRCTLIAKDDADAVARANAFSARLIAERLPVTFPAEGWDKLIFPVKLCRDYLESLIPTRETVRSYFARD